MILRYPMRSLAVDEIRAGGKRGGGSPYTVSSYGTAPPASTHTGSRHIGPQVAGSSGGFIGLISGISLLLILAGLAALYLWNRYRKRLPPKRTHNTLPSLSALGLSNPQSESWRLHSDPYTGETAARPLRPGYARQRSSEWELPTSMLPPNHPVRRDGEDNYGVELPGELDEAALPLRSKSPRPVSPAIGYLGTGTGIGNGGNERKGGKGENPFEDGDEDKERLSPRSQGLKFGSGQDVDVDSESDAGDVHGEERGFDERVDGNRDEEELRDPLEEIGNGVRGPL